MQLAMIGLGRMGGNMTERLIRNGHSLVVFDPSTEAVAKYEKLGAKGVKDLAAAVAAMPSPRVLWVMVPAGDPVDQTIATLRPLLSRGDVIIDGGNSNFHDTIRRGTELSEHGIDFMDAGTSGGVWGLENGYCLMVGGPDGPVTRCKPIFTALAPEKGYAHVGPTGSGHYVKMVHNGIEYGLMAAYAEGLNILKNANAGTVARDNDAETAPLEHPEYYQYDIDIASVTEVWRRGSVIASWLLDLTAAALVESPDLHEYSGSVSDSGEGRWTAIAAIEESVPAPVLLTALASRFGSRGLDHFADQTLSAMRKQFGGHAEKPVR
jgi:6-phosphogluconate dehydrogenase